MARSGHAHSTLFNRARKVFLNIIDKVLEPRVARASIGPDTDEVAGVLADSYGVPDEIDFLGTMDLGVVFD